MWIHTRIQWTHTQQLLCNQEQVSLLWEELTAPESGWMGKEVGGICSNCNASWKHPHRHGWLTVMGTAEGLSFAVFFIMRWNVRHGWLVETRMSFFFLIKVHQRVDPPCLPFGDGSLEVVSIVVSVWWFNCPSTKMGVGLEIMRLLVHSHYTDRNAGRRSWNELRENPLFWGCC